MPEDIIVEGKGRVVVHNGKLLEPFYGIAHGGECIVLLLVFPSLCFIHGVLCFMACMISFLFYGCCFFCLCLPVKLDEIGYAKVEKQSNCIKIDMKPHTHKDTMERTHCHLDPS